KHFLANAWDRAGRLKRGGGVEHVSWDWESADHRFRTEGTVGGSPDGAFDREWALALLERVIGRLREECVAAGKEALFEATKPGLMGGDVAGFYASAAGILGMDEGAVRVAVHRMRKRYRVLLRSEIAETLEDPTQAAEELRSLRAALGG
ncbi:MAG: sigma-70 family RNA polymerase sigma factor, partial [Verrucomicrobiales bacterium]|nr:sigma-70 family RNA polymerase sigma factor [Verrucomicrobiales bacterium]